jgi:hypothetical protein
VNVKGIIGALALFVPPLFCLWAILTKAYWTGPEYYSMQSVMIYVYLFFVVYLTGAVFWLARPDKMDFAIKVVVVFLQVCLLYWTFAFVFAGL